jgi:hypothetical protein
MQQIERAQSNYREIKDARALSALQGVFDAKNEAFEHYASIKTDIELIEESLRAEGVRVTAAASLVPLDFFPHSGATVYWRNKELFSSEREDWGLLYNDAANPGLVKLSETSELIMEYGFQTVINDLLPSIAQAIRASVLTLSIWLVCYFTCI